MVNTVNMPIQIAKNNSRSKKCHCTTKSAFERNLKARASSKNPRKTLTVFNQPPDFGSEFIHPGNAANKANGSAKANEKPNIPTKGAIPPIVADSTNKVPTIGPVQEKETNASASAIKKIPINPPLSDALSALFSQELGSMISKAPKNEIANTTSNTKKSKLNQTFVDNAFNAEGPKIVVTIVPKIT